MSTMSTIYQIKTLNKYSDVAQMIFLNGAAT
jgi:hypothetical protein